MEPKKDSPAETLISKFGGVRPLARAIGRDPAAVSRWQKTGRIPSAIQRKCLDIARKLKIKLTALDLIGRSR